MSLKLMELREPRLDAREPLLDARDPRLLLDDTVKELADRLWADTGETHETRLMGSEDQGRSLGMSVCHTSSAGSEGRW